LKRTVRHIPFALCVLYFYTDRALSCLLMDGAASELECITYHECSCSPIFAVQSYWSLFARVLVLNDGPVST